MRDLVKSPQSPPPFAHALPRLIELSRKALEDNQPPFSALLISRDGAITAEAFSTQGPAGGIDFFNHAESTMLRSISGNEPDVDLLREHWILSSCEPCPWCASAITAFDMPGTFFLLTQEWVSELRGFSRYQAGKNSTDTLDLYPGRVTDFKQIADAADETTEMKKLFESYQRDVKR